jgi:hypothetical protein
MSGPVSWLISLVLGLVGALLGYLIFTVGLGIGDIDIFDWGGVLSAVIGDDHRPDDCHAGIPAHLKPPELVSTAMAAGLRP